MVRMRMFRWCFAAAALGVIAPARAASLPACAPDVEIAGADIVRVENNGVLVLADGRAADAEGLLLPLGARDRAPGFLARRALDAIREIVHRSRATLVAEVPKEDRYGRLRAQVFLRAGGDQVWLQRDLLRRGLARVNIAPDRPQCAQEFYAAEREARAARLGIWANSAYAVRAPDGLSHDTGTFQIVEGVVTNADVRSGRAYINFGGDWRTDFTATVSQDDMKAFREAGVDPRTLQGKRVRVRGWIELLDGPEMELGSPEAIEVLGPAAVPALRPTIGETKRPG